MDFHASRNACMKFSSNTTFVPTNTYIKNKVLALHFYVGMAHQKQGKSNESVLT